MENMDKEKTLLTLTERWRFAMRGANGFLSVGLLPTVQGGYCYHPHSSDE